MMRALGVVGEHSSLRFSLMPIALIADKCASHIFHKHVGGTEEGRSSFFSRSKEPGERNDSIDKKHASRHNLPERKKTGGEDSYLQATAVALSIT